MLNRGESFIFYVDVCKGRRKRNRKKNFVHAPGLLSRSSTKDEDERIYLQGLAKALSVREQRPENCYIHTPSPQSEKLEASDCLTLLSKFKEERTITTSSKQIVVSECVTLLLTSNRNLNVINFSPIRFGNKKSTEAFQLSRDIVQRKSFNPRDFFGIIFNFKLKTFVMESWGILSLSFCF